MTPAPDAPAPDAPAPDAPAPDAPLVARALDPLRSVVVSACAGSGKTWLLVARIFRLLLDGADPSAILAITFTRKAAQEMESRLERLLESAALADDDSLDRLLAERAVVPRSAADRAVIHARARSLYEDVLTAEPRLTLCTFHSWFLQIVQRAPLSAGTLAGSTLADSNAALIEEAIQGFGVRAARGEGTGKGIGEGTVGGTGEEIGEGIGTGKSDGAPPVDGRSSLSRPTLAEAADRLFAECGLDGTMTLLRSLISHRAEWWAMTRTAADPLEDAIERLRAALPPALRDEPSADPVAALHADAAFALEVSSYHELLTRSETAVRAVEYGSLIGRAMAAATPAAWFGNLCMALFTDAGSGKPFRYGPTKVRQKRLGVDGDAEFLRLNGSIVTRLEGLRLLRSEQQAFMFNVAAFTCAVTLLREYDSIKQQRQAIDFADLERHACELLTDEDHAAFLHARLDSRYRHLLLDEFQDTNPLQWMALRAWLDAAQAAQSAPSVFLVGDPKQSIYRFRGADARLFDAASAFLVDQFDADVLDQDVSRRCASPVIELVNALFDGNGSFRGFRPHAAFDRHKPGRIEVLTLAGADIVADSGADAGADAGAVIDAVTDADPSRHVGDARASMPDESPSQDAGDAWATADACRDPLLEARRQDEDLRVAREAAQLVDGLRRLRTLSVLDERGVERPVSWRDVLVLVRTRGKLTGYERALRDAAIPYNSSRQGGLLDTLEVLDLRALLRFLVAPHDDLALAHALRSPVFSLSDADLIAIATAAVVEPANGWYQRLVAQAGTATASAELQRAAALIERWFSLARTRPVHDLLDAIYFEADVLARYRASVAKSAAPAIEANLLALLEHALAADSGRFPTLARFVCELDDLASMPAQEAPDEANPGLSDDAVRIMTVHGAKGLEAPIVWLLNSAAAAPPARGNAALIDWPAEAPAPMHFSFWSRRDKLACGQREVFDRARALDAREDLNLLYVAVTRARQVLVVSGHQLRGSANSWYAQLRRAMLALRGGGGDAIDAADDGDTLVHGDALPLCPVPAKASAPVRTTDQSAARQGRPRHREQAATLSLEPRIEPAAVAPGVVGDVQTAARRALLRDPGVRYGDAFHRLLERITDSAASVPATQSIATITWAGGARLHPPDVVARERLREWLQVSSGDFDRLWQQAERVLCSAELARFFDPGQHLRARNELAFLDPDGGLRRIDRLVEFTDEVWVLDYKTGTPDALAPHLDDYLAQIGAYADAMRQVFPGKAVRAALVLGDGRLLPLADSRGTDA